MKKLVKILLPFLVATSTIFSGCKKDKEVDNRILLSFGDMSISGSKEITVQELSQIKADKGRNSFLLVVNSTTCTCWEEFQPNIDKYAASRHVFCYRITYDNVKDIATSYGLNALTKGSTTLAIFENGELKVTLSTDENSKIMYDESRFFEYMDSTVRAPSCYYITKEDYDMMKTNRKSAVIYFSRSECGDCNALEPGILRSYIKNHPSMNDIYVLDCQPYWRRRDAEDYDSYLAMKDELGLSTVNNPVYGYGAGVFPYFMYLENGNYASGAVVYNDSVNTDLVVTDSYYTAERAQVLQYTDTVLVGKQLSDDDVNKSQYGVSWTHESADKAYEPILTAFLDYALPKIN